MMIIVIIIIVSAANNHSFAFQRGAPWRKSHVIATARFVERADAVKPHFQHLAAATRISILSHYDWKLSGKYSDIRNFVQIAILYTSILP